MPIYFLSEGDVSILKEIINDYRQRRWNTPPRLEHEGEGYQTPETYIAWPPEGGIPALTVVGTAGPGGNDQPGKATCDIYRIDNLAATPDLNAVPDLTKIVYNLSSEAVPQEWTVVQRTKFGNWVTVSPAILPEGSTTNDILYWDESGTVPEWVILPAPAASGDFALTVSDGVLAWTSISAFACPE